MNQHRRRKRKLNWRPLALLAVICLAVSVILLVRGLSPRFRDVTLELGQPMPELSAFYTKYADPEKAELLSELSQVDVSSVGDYALTFRCGDREETVTLSVRDTTAPKVTFRDASAYPGGTVDATDFIDTATDLSEYSVSFVQQPQVAHEFCQLNVQVKVTDAHGNETVGDCLLHYTWLRDNVILELGQKLQISDLLLGGEEAPGDFDHSQIDAVNAGTVGQYQITAGDRISLWAQRMHPVPFPQECSRS